MEETILSFNITNWITVVLMALLAYFVVVGASMAYQGWQAKQGSG